MSTAAVPTTAALEVLGITADYRVTWRWHSPDGSTTDEFDATEDELETLLAALRDPSQPLWPRESCRFCDTDAAVLIQADPYCHGHALAYSQMEDPR